MHIYTHTHTHTHIYIYSWHIYIYIYIYMYSWHIYIALSKTHSVACIQTYIFIGTFIFCIVNKNIIQKKITNFIFFGILFIASDL